MPILDNLARGRSVVIMKDYLINLDRFYFIGDSSRLCLIL